MPTSLRARLPAFVAGAALGLLAGCAAAPPSPVEAPRLVVVIVVDGLPQRQVTGYRGQLGRDGFNRFLQHGAWFANAHYGHAHTLTAPGHAAILTGAYPHRTGVIDNEWTDPATGEEVYCTGDPASRYIGHPTAALDGTSPRNLLAESLGDVLRRAEPRAKVIAVSGKDRGAILPAGRDGTAYMYMKDTGTFVSTTWYMRAHPAWVTAFDDARPADRYFKATWSPVLPPLAYSRAAPDGEPWMAPGAALPKVMGAGLESPGPRFYASLRASPFIDALTLDFARAAIAGEALGADDATDILAISLSGHDYVNHAWSAESRISQDHLLQVDDLLAAFFGDLDQAVGKGRYVAVLTTDHGFTPAPEYARSRGGDAGRLDPRAVLARLEAGLAARFGEGPWARGWSAHGVLLDRPLAARKGVDARALGEEARRLLAAERGIAAAFTRAEIESEATPPAPYLEAVRKTWHPARSADVQVVPQSGWLLTSYPRGTSHGSPHDYDTHVPILFYGPPWVKPGRVDAAVEVVDIAPTLARMIGTRAPSSSEGRPLPLPP